MSELGGITELQLLEAEVALLKKKLSLAQKADNTSACCSKLASAITSKAAKDGFLESEGPPNKFHSPANGAGEDACCVVL